MGHLLRLFLERIPAKWNRFADRDTLQSQRLGQILIAKALHTFAGFALVLAIALTAITAEAATKKKPAPVPEKPKPSYELPMTVAIVRSDAPGCEPLCSEWIAAEGEITTATPGLFRKALKAAGKKKLPVIINSPGGQMSAALEIGRMIRKAKLDVAVGWTLYGGCKPTDKACKLPKEQKGIYRGTVFVGRGFCNSACPLLLASGIQRLSGVWTYVGVHQVRTTWYRERVTYREKYRIVNGKKKVIDRKIVSRKPFKSLQKDGIDKRLRKSLTAYFTEMGVSLDVIEDMNRAPFTSIYQLTTARQQDLKLVTSRNDATSLTSAAACRTAVAAANCIQGPGSSSPSSGLSGNYRRSLELVGIASNARAMTIGIVRSHGPDCEPRCPQWIAADGVITPETPALFKKVLEQAGSLRLPVVIESFGGDFDAALEIGEMIRERQLDVELASTDYFGCGPREAPCKGGAQAVPYRGFISTSTNCHGACIFILAAGQTRIVSLSTAMNAYNPSLFVSRNSKQDAAVRLNLYFSKMGLGPLLLQLMHKIPVDEKLRLTDEDIERTGLATSRKSAKSLIEAEACKASAPPAYCVPAKL